MLSTTVMMTTMMAVIIVSRLDGQTTFAVSARTCRMNSPGVVFATVFQFQICLLTAAQPQWDWKAELLLSRSAAHSGVVSAMQAVETAWQE